MSKRDFQINFTYHVQDVPVLVEAHGRFRHFSAAPDDDDSFCELDSVTVNEIEIDPSDIQIFLRKRWVRLDELLIDAAFDEATRP